MSKKLYPRSMKSQVDECSVYESLGLNYPAVRCVAHTNVKWEHVAIICIGKQLVLKITV